MSDEGNKAERRQRPREIVAAVADIETAPEPPAEGSAREQDVIGIIRDISTIGARLLTYVDLEAGDPIELVVRLPAECTSGDLRIAAKVVRVIELEAPQRGLWRRAVAVHFDEELVGCDEALTALAAEAKKLIAGRD